jgi:hypothetical protein
MNVAALMNGLSFLIDFAAFEIERQSAEMTVSPDGNPKLTRIWYGT